MSEADVDIPGVGTIHLESTVDIGTCKVLCLDDEPEYIQSTEQKLTQMADFRFAVARTPPEATEELERTDFDVIMGDVRIDEADIGDDWLLKCAERAPNARKVAITGHRGEIKDPEALARHGIEIIDKGSDQEKRFHEEIVTFAVAKKERALNRFRARVRAAMQDYSDDSVPGATTEEAALHGVRELLLDWLETRPDVEARGIWIGTREFSFAELGEEVRNRTSDSGIGRYLVELFVRHLRDSLGVLPRSDAGKGRMGTRD